MFTVNKKTYYCIDVVGELSGKLRDSKARIQELSEANARAKMLIYLIENKLI